MMEVHPGGNTHIPAQSHISFAICLTVIIKKSGSNQDCRATSAE